MASLKMIWVYLNVLFFVETGQFLRTPNQFWSHYPCLKGSKMKIVPAQEMQVIIPIGSMYGIYGNIYHQYTPNVSIYTILVHGSYGIGHRSAYGNTRKNRIAGTLWPLLTTKRCCLIWKKQCQTAWEETLVPLKGLPFLIQGAIGKG